MPALRGKHAGFCDQHTRLTTLGDVQLIRSLIEDIRVLHIDDWDGGQGSSERLERAVAICDDILIRHGALAVETMGCLELRNEETIPFRVCPRCYESLRGSIASGKCDRCDFATDSPVVGAKR